MHPLFFAMAVAMAPWALFADLKLDETVVFFPTYGVLDANAGTWTLPVHAWVFEPEEDSIRRAAALGVMRRLLGLEADGADTELFRQRARAFLVDNERGKRLTIRLAGKEFALEESGANGHSRTEIKLPLAAVTAELAAQLALTDEPGGRRDWLRFDLLTPPGDGRTIAGAISIVDSDGLSIVSDIDDTIKITEVRDRAALLANTFLREFRAVEGMADLYRAWQREGAAFHYVSSSPWQLFQPLEQFRRSERFPAGTFHMKQFRVKDSSVLDLLAGHDEHKLGAIEPLLVAFPRRRFWLVGDSGERDPEIYGHLARKYPQQIERVMIRNVSNELRDAARYVIAFQDVSREKWVIFGEARELSNVNAQNGD